MSSELIASAVTFVLLIIAGATGTYGRVMVLPLLFTLIMILLYWAARPKVKREE